MRSGGSREGDSVIQFHVARRVDDRGCSLAGAPAVRHRPFVTDGPDQNARVVETGELFFGDAAEVHGQGLRFSHAVEFSGGEAKIPKPSDECGFEYAK